MGRRISVIMPAYNAERYVAESIRSVVGQTCDDWELFVVDDGSTDGTAEVVQGFASADERVKYLFQQNGGQGKARNAGIRASGGELVAFLDSDDLWEPEKLSLQVAALDESGADVVFGDAFIFVGDETADEGLTFSAICPEFIYGARGGAEAFQLLFAYNRIPTLTVLARRRALDEVGLFEEGREYQNCEDYDLWLKLAARGATFFGMRERLARYRRHTSSMMNADSRLLKPMLAVARRHSPLAGEREARRVVRDLYRALISALVEEGKIAEARRYVGELSEWDGGGFVTPLQKVLIKLAPGKYNFISRECLYRIEWHVARMLSN
ncbi:MAG TPA: glycosyltransferase family 2 protein [Pyrinomonadaceae bacterium]|nr:glycosyltransferase family 2 protein [Pyrinomonadaceae bacterium]